MNYSTVQGTAVKYSTVQVTAVKYGTVQYMCGAVHYGEPESAIW